MIEYLTIKPAPELAGRFAQWCVNRDASVRTVSAGGFLVPLDWYADVPAELLDGAYVDGFKVEVPQPQPLAPEPSEDPSRAVKPLPRRPRKQAAKKRSSSTQPSGVAALTLGEFTESGSDVLLTVEFDAPGKDGGTDAE